MASYGDVLAALPNFRNDLLRPIQLQRPLVLGAEDLVLARPWTNAFSMLALPLSNIHATGVGIKRHGRGYNRTDHVLKVYVFNEELARRDNEKIPAAYQGVPVDVEELPIQRISPPVPAQLLAVEPAASLVAPLALPQQRTRQRPILPGLSISPLDANYVGTLGCFLTSRADPHQALFILSNNHVLADVNSLKRGTAIVQPGPETPPFTTPAADVFAQLYRTIRIQFPGSSNRVVHNRFDAAIARVADPNLIELGAIFRINKYEPSRVLAPLPGMNVIKSGRTTGVTRGVITATTVNDVKVNYGTENVPRIAVFDGTIEITSLDGNPFSMPGDSGSLILEESSGHPVALLFAGDGDHTTACDLGPLCQRLGAWPV